MLDLASPRAQFGLRFSLLARRWRQSLDLRLAAAGLTDATWPPLVHLEASGGGITQKDLAARMGIDSSTLVRLIDILCRQELIERRSDPDDGRVRLVYLTTAGVSRVANIRATLAKEEEEMLAGIPDIELETMLRHFSTIEQRLCAHADGEAVNAKGALG